MEGIRLVLLKSLRRLREGRLALGAEAAACAVSVDMVQGLRSSSVRREGVRQPMASKGFLEAVGLQQKHSNKGSVGEVESQVKKVTAGRDSV